MRRRNPRRCASRTISPLSSRIARMNCTIQMLASTATRFPARVSTDTRRPTGASSSHSPCTPISLHARAGGRRTGALGGSARRGAGATPSRSERVGWLTGYDSPCRRFGVGGPSQEMVNGGSRYVGLGSRCGPFITSERWASRRRITYRAILAYLDGL
jgi:hypothetical protein